VVVTVTSTVPLLSAGDVAVSEVDELNVTLVAAVEPKLTVLPAVNPVPVMETEVPPAVGPDIALTAVTLGVAAAAGVANTTTTASIIASATNSLVIPWVIVRGRDAD
jgi:hypothetical protein